MKGNDWKANFNFLIIYFLYWTVLSWFDRTAFLISNWSKIDNVSDIFLAYYYGALLDFSLSSYLLVIPFLFFVIQHLFLKKAVSPWLLRIYTLVPTVLFALISIVNLPLYEAWGEKISKRAILLGAGTVGGVSSSVDSDMLIQAGIVLVCFFTVAHYAYHLLVVPIAKYRPQSKRVLLISALIAIISLFTLIRGGYGRAALNPSVAYFSDNNVSNHLAVNTYWSFLKNMTKSSKKNPYQFMSDSEATKLTNEVLLNKSDSAYQILKTDRPNVVLVILEGMVGQVFAELGGEPEVTPHMTQLMKEGVNFTRAYAAADRSDKGMIAVMSGFPAQGTESIIQYIPKHEKLPAIGQLYDSLHYNTSFYHGGQSQFYNFKSYMFTHGIHQVVDNANFGLDVKRNSWGVYDHVIAQKMLQDLTKEEKPFFSIFYTLVNHEPFDLDEDYKFGNKTKGDAYRSTSFYTDSMLYSMVENAKKESWYDNTIFVVVSDHGSIYPTGRFGLEQPERYHIPLFFFGGALKDEFRGTKMTNVVSQLDIASTLWSFVSKEPSPYKYSRNLFGKHKENFAFINSNNTFGVITNQQTISYDLQGQKVAYIQSKSESASYNEEWLSKAKAYYQSVFKDFTNY